MDSLHSNVMVNCFLSIPEMESTSINAIFACFIAGTIAIGATPGGIGLYPYGSFCTYKSL